MATLAQKLSKEWWLFTRDAPGQRFVNHYRRSRRDRSVGKSVVRLALGVVLTAAGVVMWFIPGPGWLFVVFGMAMFAGESRGLSGFLDGTEVSVRAQAHRIRLRCDAAPPLLKALAVFAALAAVGLGSAAVWAAWA